MGLNGLTAWRAVDELGLTAGQTLVVVGAAGSVGGFALELAASRGVRVIAAVSERDRETVLALGATGVAPREAGDLGAAVRDLVPGGADALFDTTRSLGSTGSAAIRDGGLYVTVTDGPEPERGITVTKVYGGPDAAALRVLADMAASGKLHTPVARAFPAGPTLARRTKSSPRARAAAGSSRGRSSDDQPPPEH